MLKLEIEEKVVKFICSVFDSLGYKPTQFAAPSKDDKRSCASQRELLMSEISSAKSVSVTYSAGWRGLVLGFISIPFFL